MREGRGRGREGERPTLPFFLPSHRRSAAGRPQRPVAVGRLGGKSAGKSLYRDLPLRLRAPPPPPPPTGMVSPRSLSLTPSHPLPPSLYNTRERSLLARPLSLRGGGRGRSGSALSSLTITKERQTELRRPPPLRRWSRLRVPTGRDDRCVRCQHQGGRPGESRARSEGSAAAAAATTVTVTAECLTLRAHV